MLEVIGFPLMTIHTGRHFLQIPGPTNVPDRVLREIAMATIDHRGPEFAELGLEVLDRLRGVFRTRGPVVVFPASGTGAAEAALVNTLSPGDRILIFETGWFSHIAWRQVAERLGLTVEYVPGTWRHGASPETLEQRLNGLNAVSADVDHKLAEQLARRADLETLKSACDSLGTQMLDAHHKLAEVRALQGRLVPLVEDLTSLHRQIEVAQERIGSLKYDEGTIAAQQKQFAELVAASRTVAVDVAEGTRVLAHGNWQPDRTAAPTLLALHGLEGSSLAPYMRGLADKAFAAGFNVVRLNQRNCGGTEHLSRGLYHSGLTADPMFVLHELRDRDGEQPRPHAVIEEIRLGLLARVVDCARDQRRIGDDDAGKLAGCGAHVENLPTSRPSGPARLPSSAR